MYESVKCMHVCRLRVEGNDILEEVQGKTKTAMERGNALIERRFCQGIGNNSEEYNGLATSDEASERPAGLNRSLHHGPLQNKSVEPCLKSLTTGLAGQLVSQWCES